MIGSRPTIGFGYRTLLSSMQNQAVGLRNPFFQNTHNIIRRLYSGLRATRERTFRITPFIPFAIPCRTLSSISDNTPFHMEYRGINIRESLTQDINILSGVGEKQKEILNNLSIFTVFDLGVSKIFSNAKTLLEIPSTPANPYSQIGNVPADMIKPRYKTLIFPVEEIYQKPVTWLQGIDDSLATSLNNFMQVTTIGDLACWSPYLNAKALVDNTFFPENVKSVYDAGTPEDLLPKSGEYATEKVFYQTYVMAALEEKPEIRLEDSTPINLSRAFSGGVGFKKPAIGAQLTFEQAWYRQGEALGSLLHSVALAPGESTNIAMIDWTRKVQASSDESVGQTEDVSQSTEHARSLSEVTAGVATEAQAGFSFSKINSQSSQTGSASGSGFLQSVFLGTRGGSYSEGTSDTHAFSLSVSAGRREMSASLTQDVNDRTHQYANSARNRRATIVKEVSQNESESVSTRNITNYNHMHALSIKYYEVVQVYRVATRVSDVQPLLFIPVELIDFSNIDSIDRYRKALLNAALTKEVREALLSKFNGVMISPVIVKSPRRLPKGSNPISTLRFDPSFLWRSGDSVGWKRAELNSLQAMVPEFDLLSGLSSAAQNTINLPDKLHIQTITNSSIDDFILTVQKKSGEILKFSLAAASSIEMSSSLILDQIVQISMNNPTDGAKSGTLQMQLKSGDKSTSFSLPYYLSDKKEFQPIANFKPSPQDTEKLIRHLQENKLYYSQAVYQNLDASLVSAILSPYSFYGAPVLQIVDAKPLAVYGNSLVFRMNPDSTHALRNKWDTWIQEQKLDDSNREIKQDYIPLPSNGVFAEAVLGRSNSAEKLDLTRYWNWQDSPIPNAAPAIAPIQTGTRARDENVTPGQLAAPIVNITNPVNLPDPGASSAMLNALTASNIFRDMSGLAGTIAAAQAATQTTSNAASNAGQLAGENMKTAADFNKAVLAAIKDAAIAALGGVPPGGSTPPTSSNAGAKLNYGRDRDQRAGSNPISSITGRESSPGTRASPSSGPSTGSPSGVPGNRPSPSPEGQPSNPSSATPNEDVAYRDLFRPQTVPPAAGQSGPSATSDFYEIPGSIPIIRQVKSMGCWATVGAMLYAWKYNPSASPSIESYLTHIGREYLEHYNRNLGIPVDREEAFFQAAGLIVEPPMSYTPRRIGGLLRRYGPLWAETDEDPTKPSAHVRIITAIRGDGTFSGTELRLIDPARGIQVWESFFEFFDKFNESAESTPYPDSPSARIQMVHYP